MSGKRLLAGLALALIPLALFAQITVKVQPPPANQLKFDDLWSVEIANTAERTFNVYLKAELSAITPDNRVEPVAKAVSGNFKLPSGTRKLTRADFAEVFRLY